MHSQEHVYSWLGRRFVGLCWIAQIFKYIPDPKPSYIADWDDLPEWQRETDADIFQRIESDQN